ncbi:peptidase M13 [Bifidobacterium ramosum]|uniref:Peptidase M13 n=1 Tax=Bifidobacterium ramosum TaxID=1798158 RepID=A0A6L4X0M0_9BIFI|nr:M13-type metalloendopeptidase [Bifidobacterium ramosum]KAB8287961.1 peptidase M13 [Bifidobacterium ramosum]NEG72018.1 peptidase M13 [Bifidobacterium ramosum]
MSTVLTSGLDPAAFSSVIKPSDDFFRYVNGPWIDTYRLPDDKARYGAFEKLAEDSENQIHEILEDDACPAVKSRALYRSFLDTDAIEQAGITPLKPVLAAIDDAADKTALTRVLGQYDPSDATTTPFGFGIYGDPADPDTNVVHIEQSGLGLPDEAYYREDRYEPIRTAYVDMVAKQLRNAGYGDVETTDVQAKRFLDVETRIAAHHWDNVTTRDPQKTNNPTDFATLSGELAHFDLPAWAGAWQQAYDATAAAAAQPVDLHAALSHVIVHEPSFLTGFDQFWDTAELDDLKLWARVHAIIGTAAYLSRDFDETNFDFYGKVLSGAKVQRDRWKRAVSLVNGICGEDVGREYVRRHFPESSKQRMEQLVANLIDAYRVSISGSTWLGEATKTKALEKLSKFTPMIGYTEHWRDYGALDVREDATLVENMAAASLYENGYQLAKAGKPVDKGEWEMNPQTVNAYYDPSKNVIVFPAAILQPPFFNPEADDAANYGGIGAVIGHEIGHGFDDQGSQFDGDGKLNNWWTTEDRANFEQRTTALIEQYNAFVPTQLAEKYADDPSKAPHVNGALTIGENIGDLGGVNIALKAYAFALDEAAGRPKDGSPEAIKAALDTAPVMDGFTGLQRFFLSYASIWRGKNRDELAEQFLQIDPHSPAECRTNGIVRNVDLFYTAFGVHDGDGMWLAPEQRVSIW